MTVVVAGGLAAAIFSVLPAQFGVQRAGLYTFLIMTSVGATAFRSHRVSSTQ